MRNLFQGLWSNSEYLRWRSVLVITFFVCIISKSLLLYNLCPTCLVIHALTDIYCNQSTVEKWYSSLSSVDHSSVCEDPHCFGSRGLTQAGLLLLLQDFTHAKQLFAACLELVTEFSPKLRQVMLNEMLLLDIHTHEAGLGQSGERPPSDLISRVRGYLEMRLPGKAGACVHIRNSVLHCWGMCWVGVCLPDFTSTGKLLSWNSLGLEVT